MSDCRDWHWPIPDETHLRWTERSEGAKWSKWVQVTTDARNAWGAALHAWPHAAYGYPEPANARALRQARAQYRHQVLSWFWVLVAPLKPGQCVPDEVAELLAEAWDEGDPR